jgi:hypothetical protein
MNDSISSCFCGIVGVECSLVKSCNCYRMVKLTFLIVCE